MKRQTSQVRALFLLVASLMLLSSVASAHQTKSVGDGKYHVVVGFTKEPIYTNERNGLDLIIRVAESREPVEHLAQTLFAEIVAPDGVTTRSMPIRAQHGQPGRYTSDIVLTQAGDYKVRIWGYIHEVQFDEVFDLHRVSDMSDLRFPN